MGEAADGTRAAHAETYKSYADNGDGVGAELQHALLTCSSLRLVDDDDAVLDVPVTARKGLFAALAASEERCCEGKRQNEMFFHVDFGVIKLY